MKKQMDAKKKVLAVIPARGGSKGVKNKNLRIVAGKSLVARSVEVSIEASVFDAVVVSTDDEDIKAEAELSGARGVLEGPCSAEHERLGQGWGPAGKSQRPFGGRLRLCFLHALEEAVPGGAGRDRTGDLLNAIQALSQLSYGPTQEAQATAPHGVLSKGTFPEPQRRKTDRS